VDSYLSSTNLANGMTYDIIPSTRLRRRTRTVNLRDVLDFRPMRSNFEFIARRWSMPPATRAQHDVSDGDGEAYLIPVSDDVWLGSYQYYLVPHRQDRLGLRRHLPVIEGQDDRIPVAPTDDNGTLAVVPVVHPAYTLVDADGVPTTVLLTTFDHKRYTMQDLSKMDDRVSHLEYYTALSGWKR
jgi:hypothetical protein